MTVQEYLSGINACEPAQEWAKGRTIESVINDCERGDWLIWLAKKMNLDLRRLTLAKALCAKTVIHLMKDERSKNAVLVAEQFGLDNATLEDLRNAAAAAAAYAYADAVDAAAYAAYAAADDVDDVDDAVAAAAYAAAVAAATNAAANATNAAAYAASAADAAYAAADARKENQMQTANICREVFGEWIINELKSKLKEV